ncbi:uncharacterized protein LOC116344407 [Contarinia nasturtii]|uniref:uncharacterized protein LOC116344407 n=1 Tax=Contarinia nasturtii TaxID=265458 RepID=UPI0012D3C4C2|nr:uncharacterized protein LOC116344407 [Contarinia nasturtii]
MIVKVLRACVIISILWRQSFAASKLIGAKSIDEIWEDQSFHKFWNSITEFLLANTVTDPNFRKYHVDHGTVDRLEKQINEGNYKFDYADRHEVWRVFEHFMEKLENQIVPLSTAKIVRLCDVRPGEVEIGLDALSKLPKNNKKFIVKLSKFLRRVCSKTTKFVRGNIFGPGMDAWLTPYKQKSSHKSLCGRGKRELEIIKYFIYGRMSENFGDIIGYRNEKFHMIKYPGVESTCKVFKNPSVAQCWNSRPLQDFLENSLTFMRENCLMLDGFFKKDGKRAERNAMQREIENGLQDYSGIKNKHILVQLFKCFLKGFKESVIPHDVAVIIRNNPKDQIVQKLNAVLDALNELPNANKMLIDNVLRLMRDAANIDSNNMDAADLAIMVDQCFSLPTTLTEIVDVRSQENPMLAHLITIWGDHIYLDDYLDFVQRK